MKFINNVAYIITWLPKIDIYSWLKKGLPGGTDGKVSACNAGGLGSISGLGRFPGEGNGNPLQYACLENPMAEEPCRLQSTGSQRVRHDWVTSITMVSVLKKQ